MYKYYIKILGLWIRVNGELFYKIKKLEKKKVRCEWYYG